MADLANKLGQVAQEVTNQKARADAAEAELAQVKTGIANKQDSVGFLEQVTEAVAKGFGKKDHA